MDELAIQFDPVARTIRNLRGELQETYGVLQQYRGAESSIHYPPWARKAERLREMISALEALPEKDILSGSLAPKVK